MKDSGKWAVVFTVLNIILIVTCVVLLLGRDRKAPVISFSENDLIYYSGIDNEKLLQGVAAMDAKNGDVSDRIVVEKIVQNKNEDRAVVYYAVTDLDGNVAKASRVFGAVNESTGNAMKDIGMAGFDGDMDEALSNETEGMTPEIGGNEEMQENVGDGSSLMTKITLLLLIFSAVLVLCFGDLTIGNYSNKSIRQAMSKEGTVWHDMVEITGNIISDVMEELNEKTSFK